MRPLPGGIDEFIVGQLPIHIFEWILALSWEHLALPRFTCCCETAGQRTTSKKKIEGRLREVLCGCRGVGLSRTLPQQAGRPRRDLQGKLTQTGEVTYAFVPENSGSWAVAHCHAVAPDRDFQSQNNPRASS